LATEYLHTERVWVNTEAERDEFIKKGWFLVGEEINPKREISWYLTPVLTPSIPSSN
jgi:hypothetical protein